MRTTVTLDPDTEQIVRRVMTERGLSFKDALNDLVRRGVQSEAKREPFSTKTASLGASRANLDRALQLAGELEDDDLVRRMRAGS